MAGWAGPSSVVWGIVAVGMVFAAVPPPAGMRRYLPIAYVAMEAGSSFAIVPLDTEPGQRRFWWLWLAVPVIPSGQCCTACIICHTTTPSLCLCCWVVFRISWLFISLSPTSACSGLFIVQDNQEGWISFQVLLLLLRIRKKNHLRRHNLKPMTRIRLLILLTTFSFVADQLHNVQMCLCLSVLQTTYVQLYHPALFLIPSGDANICYWTVTTFPG